MKKILFVCTENACRSQMAEAFFNELANGRATAVSAGTKPSKEVNPLTVTVMREIGIDISKQKPKLLTANLIKEADKVVTMGCGAKLCLTFPIKTEDWQIEDPSGKPIEKFREIREKIKRRVEKLIKELV